MTKRRARLTASRLGSPWAPFFLWLLAVTLSPWMAQAQAEATSEDEYRRIIATAVTEFDAGNWSEARAMFKRAHAVKPNARTFRALGFTAYELRHYVEAVQELEQALADQRSPLTEVQRKETQEVLRRAREYVASYRLHIDPRGARVRLDGNELKVGADGVVLLNPGTHSLEVRAPGRQVTRRTLNVDAGQEQDVNIRLTVAAEAPGVQPEPPAEEADTADEGGTFSRYKWTWGLSAGALAGGVAVLGTALPTAKKEDDYRACTADCEGLRKDGQRLKRITNAMVGVAAGLGVAVGVAFVIEHKHSTSQASSSLSLGPFGARYTRRF